MTIQGGSTQSVGEQMPNDFAQLLRRFRKRAGLTQSELAAKVGVHSSYVSRIERSEREAPSREILHHIADALGLEPGEINEIFLAAGYAPVADSTTRHTVDPALNLIADLFEDRRISEAELNLLREYAILLDRLRSAR